MIEPRNLTIPERILMFGNSGGGRSNAIITWMREQPDVHFHILDNEDAYPFLIYEDEELNAGIIKAKNFTIHTVRQNDYSAHIDVLEKVKDDADAGDVFVFDKIGPHFWDAVQAEYTRRVFGSEIDAYMVEMRRQLEEVRESQRAKGDKEKGNQASFDQLRDWGVINTMFERALQLCVDVNMMSKAHVVWIADATQTRDNDAPAIRAMYKKVGERPTGNKANHAWPHTILHFAYDSMAREYVINGVKDRGGRRKNMLDDKVWGTDEEPEEASFADAYLVPVAGWKGEGKAKGEGEGKGEGKGKKKGKKK